MSVIKNFNHFLNTTPARRIFEIENILSDLISKIREDNVYIIIEDIDRSGDFGIFFLETLNYFLKNNDLKKRIICIVPIWTETYQDVKIKTSYFKSLDYIHEYFLKNIWLKKFVQELFIDNIVNSPELFGKITSFLEWIFREYPDQITMRELKLILRNANNNYITLYKDQWEWIDWRLSILFEVAKYIKNQDEILYIDEWRKSLQISTKNNIFSALAYCVFVEWHRIKKYGYVFQDIYEDTYVNDKKQKLPIWFSDKIPLKIISWKYAENSVKDSILYMTNHFWEEGYAWISNDYLY